MPKHLTLPGEVHDHFRRANVLHGYVQTSLGAATQHALETGRELLAAKGAIPHGSWESECDRLFDGSARTAQFYMQFSKHVSTIPKAQSVALLVLEGTLVGAAKAAKQATKPPEPKPPRKGDTPAAVTHDVEPASVSGEDADSGRTPQEPSPRPPRNGTDKPGVPDPFEEATDPFSGAPESPETGWEPQGASGAAKGAKARQKGDGKPPKQFDRSYWFKQWDQTIGPLVRLVDKIAEGVCEKHDPHHEAIQDRLNEATEEMMEWMGVK